MSRNLHWPTPDNDGCVCGLSVPPVGSGKRLYDHIKFWTLTWDSIRFYGRYLGAPSTGVVPGHFMVVGNDEWGNIRLVCECGLIMILSDIRRGIFVSRRKLAAQHRDQVLREKLGLQ